MKDLMAQPGVIGYVIFNADGIPLRKSDKTISNEKAVQYAALVSDLWTVSKKIVQKDLKNPEVFSPPKFQNDIEVIRMRTTHYTELIVSKCIFVIFNNSVEDFTIVGIQNCNPREEYVDEEEKKEGKEDEDKKD